jgi:hypothetical protein
MEFTVQHQPQLKQVKVRQSALVQRNQRHRIHTCAQETVCHSSPSGSLRNNHQNWVVKALTFLHEQLSLSSHTHVPKILPFNNITLLLSLEECSNSMPFDIKNPMRSTKKLLGQLRSAQLQKTRSVYKNQLGFYTRATIIENFNFKKCYF